MSLFVLFWGFFLPFLKFPKDYLSLGRSYFKSRGQPMMTGNISKRNQMSFACGWSKVRQTMPAFLFCPGTCRRVLSASQTQNVCRTRLLNFGAKIGPVVLLHESQSVSCQRPRWGLGCLQNAQNRDGSVSAGRCFRTNTGTFSVALDAAELWKLAGDTKCFTHTLFEMPGLCDGGRKETISHFPALI